MDKVSLSPKPNQVQRISNPALEKLFYQPAPDPVAFFDAIIHGVVGLSASDVLLEPRKEKVQVRTRIDGVLYKLGEISPNVYELIASRIKVLAKLDPT